MEYLHAGAVSSSRPPGLPSRRLLKCHNLEHVVSGSVNSGPFSVTILAYGIVRKHAARQHLSHSRIIAIIRALTPAYSLFRCCGSDGAGAAAVYEEFGSSQVAGVVGCQERDEVSDVGGISGFAKGDATDGFDDLCACGIDADL